MMKALNTEDFDTAADLAKSIAEFETPKLGRVENVNTEKDADELTDEELNALLRNIAVLLQIMEVLNSELTIEYDNGKITMKEYMEELEIAGLITAETIMAIRIQDE